ncbi:MAG: alanine racemase [Acidobacteriaceae bacterium]|nr:alanine racemase [Acidobacteriaceae bacterium]
MKTDCADRLDFEAYRIKTDQLLTPALVIYPAKVRHNIRRMITLLGGEPARWRPHLKTVKLGAMIRLLTDAHVTSAKVATTLELLTACESGMQDVLVAYPHSGRNTERIAAIAAAFPEVRVSAIVESRAQIQSWLNTKVDLFIDINPGMNRTGMKQDRPKEVAVLAGEIQGAGLVFRGLHFYDGHATEPELQERCERAHKRYEGLLELNAAIEAQGIRIEEVIVSGTPSVPCAISYAGLWNASFSCQVSPGTVVYNDVSSLAQLPGEYGFEPAVLVISRVVSHPKPGIVTCDAGHKSVSVDGGVPSCVPLGASGLQPLKPSEEHLPIEVAAGSGAPAIGTVLYLLPRHVCPTVNNFDFAAMAAEGEIVSVEPVTARGREGPLLSAPSGEVVRC